MSLPHCPECGHEVSANAVACPNCGRPLAAVPPVVHSALSSPSRRRVRTAFRRGVFIPIGVLAIVVLFLGYLMFIRSNDQGNTNVNVNMAGRRPGSEPNREIHTSTVPRRARERQRAWPDDHGSRNHYRTAGPPPVDKERSSMPELPRPAAGHRPPETQNFICWTRISKPSSAKRRSIPSRATAWPGASACRSSFPTSMAIFTARRCGPLPAT